jgi:hypothetical protein
MVEYIECLACNELIHPDGYPDGGRICPDCTNWANRESSRTLAVLPIPATIGARETDQ